MKKLLAAALASLVVIALATVIILNAPPAGVFPKAQVGIFFYVWYGAVVTDWQAPKFIDYPVGDLGNYSSLNKTMIRRQLVLIEELGVDFVVISWWGFHNTYQKLIDEAARQVFEVARSLNTTLKFAIMVEPFNKTGNSYDYQGIYNHVCDNFMEPYSDLYYNYSGRPLICFFNNESLTDNGFLPEDESSRFTVITVGQEPYAQWTYTNLTNLNETDLASYEPRRQTSVTPRFDNSQNQTKTPSITVDPDLTEGVYDQEWEKALQLAREGKIDIITISSWNEYVERTQIEPHYDGTSKKAPDFLYNKTRDYIKQVNLEKNVQIHGEDYNDFTLSHLSDFGVSWVRMDYEIGMTEWVMNALHDAGYKVLAIIDIRTFNFKVPTLEEWNNTLLSIVANPVSQLIDGWEIWNEPNALGEAYVAPSDYSEMLRGACGILRNGTNGVVVSGGLAPHSNFLTYLKETFEDSEINSYYDYFGLHLYNETMADNLVYVDEAKRVTGKEVWITEMGRPSETEVFTEESQASYLVENIKGIAAKVQKTFVYELYDGWLQDTKEDYFGLLNVTYGKKQAWCDLKELRLVEETGSEPGWANTAILVILIAVCTLAVLLLQQVYGRRK